MTTQGLVDDRSQNARTNHKKRTQGMQHRKFRVRTKGWIDIDQGEAVAHIVDYCLNGLCQKGMAGSSSDKSLSRDTGAYRRAIQQRVGSIVHEINVASNSRTKIGFQQDIHVGLETTINEQDTIST